VLGFYTVVVVVLSVAPNQIREFSPHFDSTTPHVVVVAVVFSLISKKETIPHVKVNHDYCEYVEDANELDPF